MNHRTWYFFMGVIGGLVYAAIRGTDRSGLCVAIPAILLILLVAALMETVVERIIDGEEGD